MVKLIQVNCTESPVTKRAPRDARVQYHQSSLLSRDRAESLFTERGVREPDRRPLVHFPTTSKLV